MGKAGQECLYDPGGKGRKTNTGVGGWVKLILRWIGWVDIDWIDLSLDRDQWRALVNTVMNLLVPKRVGKFLSSHTTSGFSRRAQLHVVS
jgi:hypothetical protein